MGPSDLDPHQRLTIAPVHVPVADRGIAVPLATSRPGRASLPTILTTAILLAFFVFGITAASMPGGVLGASVTKAAVCSVTLRSTASTTARARTSIKAGTKVTVTASVGGGSWRATCGGKAVSGKTWYRISAINGRSVTSLYGVTSLYAATGLFKAVAAPAVTKYAACPVYLRTSAATTASSKALIKPDIRVTVVTSVTSGTWKTTCTGKADSGTSWYRVSAVNGTSVRTLYGVTYLYAATGLVRASPATSPRPAPTPTPSPSPTPTPSPSPSPTPSPTPATMLEGIDVSHWQGPIDWTQVSAAGERFAYVKASEGTTFVDSMYLANRDQARAVGMSVGAYHFAQPGIEPGDAIAEADHFVATALPTGGDLLPVLDLERSGGLSQVDLIAWVQGYMDELYRLTGVHGVIYCSPAFWTTYMGDTPWFAMNGYDILWAAHWTSLPSPTVPGGNWGGYGWTFWQYTSSGSVPGITGSVDLNRYNGLDLTRVLIPPGLTPVPIPTPVPDPTPVPTP